jgi:hypothetical protein
VFEWRGRERIAPAAVLAQQGNDLLVRLLDDAADFLVDEPLGVR